MKGPTREGEKNEIVAGERKRIGQCDLAEVEHPHFLAFNIFRLIGWDARGMLIGWDARICVGVCSTICTDSLYSSQPWCARMEHSGGLKVG